MLKVSNLTKSYETGVVLDKINLVVSNGEKIGLVGINGSGKSTLLRIIAGLEKQDEGSVLIDKNDIVGYLPQYLDLDSALTVREFLLEPFKDLLGMQKELQGLEKQMAIFTGKDLKKALSTYGELQTRFESEGGYEFETNLDRVLVGLNLELDMERLMNTLSGGQKARIAMGQVLLKNPTILLLDEPTNHLDLPSLIWLEEYLTEGSRTIVIVSHDRRFLDRVVQRIVEIQSDHHIIEFGGDYSTYLSEKARLRERQKQEYEQQQKKFKELKEDVEKTKRQAIRSENASKDSKLRRYAKKVAKKAKSRENRLERQMQSEDLIKKPEEKKTLKVNFRGSGSRELLVRLREVSKSYQSFVTLRGVSLEIHGGERIALVGENGSGKTTLLRLIADGEQPDKGDVQKGKIADIGYLPQDQSHLISGGKKVIDWFRLQVTMVEDEARAYLGSFDFSQESLFKPISKLSNGEISRLLVSTLVAGQHNLLLLDEPTNHLDLESVEVVENALKEYQGAFVVVTHDRYLLKSIGFDRILSLKDGKIEEYSNWDSYETQTLQTQRR